MTTTGTEPGAQPGRRAADGGIDDDERRAVERGRRVTAGHREQLDQLTGMDGTGDVAPTYDAGPAEVSGERSSGAPSHR